MDRTTKFLLGAGALLLVAGGVTYVVARSARRYRERNPVRVQWHRVDYGRAPQGHALTATVDGRSWRTYEQADGSWLLEPMSPPGKPLVVGSLQEARDVAEGNR